MFLQQLSHIGPTKIARYTVDAHLKPSAQALGLKGILCTKFAGTVSN